MDKITKDDYASMLENTPEFSKVATEAYRIGYKDGYGVGIRDTESLYEMKEEQLNWPQKNEIDLDE